MTQRLVEKERYSIDPTASIHQHDCRILETKDKRIRIKIDRTRDTHPPFFTVYDLSVRKPHPPAIKVDGKVNWGFGLTWKKALTILMNELSATTLKSGRRADDERRIGPHLQGRTDSV